MPVAPVAANLGKALDVETHFFPELALNPILPVNILSEPVDLVFGEVIRFSLGIDTGMLQNLVTQCGANPVDVLQRYPDLLVSRYVNPGDTRHQTTSFPSRISALPLFMAGLGANHPDHSSPPYYLALFASGFN
jgi:hypothetical protein